MSKSYVVDYVDGLGYSRRAVFSTMEEAQRFVRLVGGRIAEFYH